MTYIKTLSTSNPNTILFFYIEVDDQFFEKRKIEIANDGLLGFADENFSFRGTSLDKNQLLTIEEINNLSGMQAWEIKREEFDEYWSAAISMAKNFNF